MKKLLIFPLFMALLASCSGDDEKFPPYEYGVPSVSALSIDFGKTAQYEKSQVKSLTVTNIAAGRLTFNIGMPDGFMFDNSSTCVNGTNTLATGGSCNIGVYAETIASGAITDNMTITTDNPFSPIVKVALLANSEPSLLIPVLKLSSDNVTFADTKRNEKSELKTITFSNTGTRNLIFTAKLPELFFSDSASTCAISVKNTLPPLANCVINIYALSAIRGEVTKEMQVTSNDAEKRNVQVKLSVKITGE